MKLRSILRNAFWGFALVVVANVSLATATAGEWKAGFARASITPAEPMWMSGYGNRTKPSEGSLTELWAKAMVIESPNGERVCLVTLDLVGISREVSLSIRQKIRERSKLELRQVALCCTHTHCGPVIRGNLDGIYAMHADRTQQISDYTDKMIERVVAVTGEAIKGLAPAKLAWGVGFSTLAVNRRENVSLRNVKNAEPEVVNLRAAGQLKGPSDYDVPVLSIRNSEDKLVGVLFGYACHATVMDFYKWSGDWPGFAMIDIEKRHPGAMALFFAGCGADQNPLPRRQEFYLTKYGEMIGSSVEAVLYGHMKPISGNLSSGYEEVSLPHDTLPTVEKLRKDAIVPPKAKQSEEMIAARARELLKGIDAGHPLSQTYPYPIQIWKLGDGPELVLLGGEVVVDYSLRFKRELNPGKTWVASYTNDVMAYIPSLRVLKEGGYEGDSSMLYYKLPTRWGPAVEDTVVKGVRALREKVIASPPKH